jgi:hypothetical protein
VVIDINQTSWRQFGCSMAGADHICFTTVTAQQRRHFVPSGFAFFADFCRQGGYFAALRLSNRWHSDSKLAKK